MVGTALMVDRKDRGEQLASGDGVTLVYRRMLAIDIILILLSSADLRWEEERSGAEEGQAPRH